VFERRRNGQSQGRLPFPELTANAWLRYDSVCRALRTARPISILEIGAGRGALGAWLARRHEYTGVEPDGDSRAAARARLAAVGRGRIVNELSDIDEQYDLVCAFEVLEHIDDDLKALRQWLDHVRPGGSLVLSVPAHQSRFGASDELAGHYRRYERSGLANRLDEAGFRDIEIWSHGAGLGYALETIRNLLAKQFRRDGSLEERTSASGRYFQPTGSITASACAVVAGPFRLVQRPFADTDIGTGYVAFARRSR